MTERIEQGIDGAVWLLDVSMNFGQDCSAVYEALCKQLNLRSLVDVLTQPHPRQCRNWNLPSLLSAYGDTESVCADGVTHHHPVYYNGLVALFCDYLAPNLVKVQTWSIDNHRCHSFGLQFNRWEGQGLSQSETCGLLALIPTELLQYTWLQAWDSSTYSGTRHWRAKGWLAAMDEGVSLITSNGLDN